MSVALCASTLTADIIRIGSDGRYVRVENTGPDNRLLHIGELEVFGFGYTPPGGLDGSSNNFALAGQGGSFESSVGGGGHGAVGAVFDNVLQTAGATWTRGTVHTNYIQDLGQNRSLGAIRVWQRADGCCQDRLSGINVSLLADNGGSPGDVVSSRTFGGQVATNSNVLLDLSDDRVIRPGGAGTIGVENVNGATGRFIRVTNNGGVARSLHIGEVEAFLAGDATPAGTLGAYISPDVAINTVGASASGNGPAGHGNAEALIDGRSQVSSATYTLGSGVGNSMTIDLGQDRNLGEIRLWQRQDGCCQERLSNFTLELLDDNGGTPGTAVVTQNFPGQVATNSNQAFATLADDFTIRGNDTLQTEIDLNAMVADLLSCACFTRQLVCALPRLRHIIGWGDFDGGFQWQNYGVRHESGGGRLYDYGAKPDRQHHRPAIGSPHRRQWICRPQRGRAAQ